MQKVLNLRCACCGGSAPALQQWWNQDRGYGICPKCVACLESRISERPEMYPVPEGRGSYIEFSYGKYGVHHSVGGA